MAANKKQVNEELTHTHTRTPNEKKDMRENLWTYLQCFFRSVAAETVTKLIIYHENAALVPNPVYDNSICVYNVHVHVIVVLDGLLHLSLTTIF